MKKPGSAVQAIPGFFMGDRRGSNCSSITRWCHCIGVVSATFRSVVTGLVRFAFGLALELVFFFAFFGELFLALFVRVIGSCHSGSFLDELKLTVLHCRCPEVPDVSEALQRLMQVSL